MINEGILTAFLALFSWVLYSMGGKRATMALGRYRSSLIVMGLGIIPCVIAYYLTGMQPLGTVQIILSSVAGIFLCAGFLFLFKALETEQLTNASALGEMQPAILTLFGIIVLQEAITFISGLSIVLIFAGEILVISTKGIEINRKLLPAVYANIAWTIYWLLESEAISTSATFAAPIMIARVVGTVFMIFLFFLRPLKDSAKFSSKAWGAMGFYTLLASLLLILDGTGDVLFGFTISLNVEAIGAAITALGPIFVYGLSYLVFKDRLTKVQLVGILVMIAGGIALTFG